MPDLDVAELAGNLEEASASLEKATAGLNRHIDEEANRRAAERGKVYAKAADERIRDNAVELQRAQDLVRELRRQMKPLERISDKYGLIIAAVRSAGWAGERTIDVQALLDIINGPALQAAREG